MPVAKRVLISSYWELVERGGRVGGLEESEGDGEGAGAGAGEGADGRDGGLCEGGLVGG